MWLLRLVGVLVVLVLIAGVGILLLPGDRIAAVAVDQVKARTGRELQIGGDVRVTFWPVLGIETGPVRLGNATWAGPEPMLTADSLSIGVSAPDLLWGEIRVRKIVANGPDLRLIRGADGRGNWEFSAPVSGPGTAASGDDGAMPVTLEDLSLSNARLSYAAPGAAPVVVAVDALTLRWPDRDGPVDLRVVARPYGDPVEIAAQIAAPAGLLAGGASAVSAQISLPGGNLGFDGRATLAGDATGRVTVEAGDSARMLAALGQAGVAIPIGLGRAADVTAEATYTADGRLSLRDLALRLDGNRLTGAADLVLSDPPQMTARLAAGVLDLTGTGGGSAASSGAGAAAEGWSRAPIDASALGLVNGSLRLTAERIDTAAAVLGGVDATLQIDRARAVLSLQSLAVFGGTVQGELVANNRGGLSVGGRLNSDGIEMQQMLGQLAGIERLSGKAAADLEFLGVGASVDAIMHSLKGKGGLRMGRGVIAGIDLDQILRGGGIGGTTVFDGLTASFVIENGDLRNDDLALQLSRFTADGKGRIGLGARDIDYLFTPVKLSDVDGRQVTISARIVGPWANPKIRPELNQALQDELDARRDELEQRAKDKAKAKLQEELGVTVEDGQSVEDALKDRVEDEAKKQLLRLLGGD
jgi:AsmA protein